MSVVVAMIHDSNVNLQKHFAKAVSGRDYRSQRRQELADRGPRQSHGLAYDLDGTYVGAHGQIRAC